MDWNEDSSSARSSNCVWYSGSAQHALVTLSTAPPQLPRPPALRSVSAVVAVLPSSRRPSTAAKSGPRATLMAESIPMVIPSDRMRSVSDSSTPASPSIASTGSYGAPCASKLAARTKKSGANAATEAAVVVAVAEEAAVEATAAVAGALAACGWH